METTVSSLLTVLAILVAIPAIVFLLEIIAATVLPRHEFCLGPDHGNRGRIAVIVPAHNEGSELLPTIGDIKVQLHPEVETEVKVWVVPAAAPK